MSAKFIFNGVEITVATAELGEAMKALGLMVPTAPAAAPAPPAHLPALASPIGASEVDRAAQAPAPRRRATLIASATPQDEIEYALKLARLIQAAGTTGALSRAVMSALGTSSSKGLGSITVMINKALTNCGFEPADVYTKTRGPFGRTWLAGPKIKEAIEALELVA